MKGKSYLGVPRFAKHFNPMKSPNGQMNGYTTKHPSKRHRGQIVWRSIVPSKTMLGTEGRTYVKSIHGPIGSDKNK